MGQVLHGRGALAFLISIGTAFTTELIADRVWRTWPQLELAVVEYVGWFNNARLHESLGGYLTQQNFASQWIGGQAKDGLNAVGIGAFFNVLNFRQGT